MGDKEFRLIGFNLTRIEAEKNPKFSGKINIEQNIKITDIKKQKLDLTKQEAVSVDFEMSLVYKELGKINLNGTLFLILDSKTMKELLKSWKKKRIPEQINVLLLNLIIQKTAAKAFQIQEELGLPPHIQIPVLRPKR